MLRAVIGILRYILDNPSNEGQKLRRLTYAAGWQLHNRITGLPLLIPLDNGLKFISEQNSTNATGVIYTRLYEPEYTIFLRKHLQSGGSILDVGAHMGLFTLQLAHLFTGGACFEPAEDTFAALVRNIRLNKLDSIAAVRSAIGSSDGEARLMIVESFGGTNRVDARGTMTVPMQTLDSYLARHPLSAPLSLLKIDVEGGEMDVLDGARRLLDRDRGAIAMVENSNTEAIVGFFHNISWKVFTIDKKGAVLTDPEALHSGYNLFACGPSHPTYSSIGYTVSGSAQPGEMTSSP